MQKILIAFTLFVGLAGCASQDNSNQFAVDPPYGAIEELRYDDSKNVRLRVRVCAKRPARGKAASEGACPTVNLEITRIRFGVLHLKKVGANDPVIVLRLEDVDELNGVESGGYKDLLLRDKEGNLFKGVDADTEFYLDLALYAYSPLNERVVQMHVDVKFKLKKPEDSDSQ